MTGLISAQPGLGYASNVRGGMIYFAPSTKGVGASIGGSAQRWAVLPGRKNRGPLGRFNGAVVKDTWDVAADVSGLVRNGFWVENTTSPNPGITQGLGYTSAGGLIAGPLQIYGALESLDTAVKVNDVAERRFAQMKLARGVIDSVTGITVTGMRTFNLASLSSTSKTVVVGATICGYMASALWSVGLGIQVVGFAIAANQARSVRAELNACKDDTEKMDLLLSKYLLSEEDFEEAKKGLTKEVLNEDVILTEEELGVLTEVEKQRANEEELPKGNSHVRACYWKELVKRKLVKEAAYKRAIGDESLALIKEACRTNTLVSKEVEIVKMAEDEVRHKMLYNGMLLFFGVIGIVSFIMTTIFTGGTALLVGYILMMVMNLVMSGVDVKGLVDRLKTLQRSATIDELAVMWLFIGVTVASTTVGALFAASLPMLITVVAAGALMFFIQLGIMDYIADNKNFPKLPEPVQKSLLPDERPSLILPSDSDLCKDKVKLD